MYQKWKKELTRRGVHLKREKQRTPRITPEQLELIDLKRMSFEDLEGVFRPIEMPNAKVNQTRDGESDWIPVRERVRRIEETMPVQQVNPARDTVRVYLGFPRGTASEETSDLGEPDWGHLMT